MTSSASPTATRSPTSTSAAGGHVSTAGDVYDVIIVGAGFAGASTAMALSERGAGRILVLDAAAVPGHHASGRNAAMARRVIGDPVLAGLATDSVAAIRERWPHLIGHSGGVLLGDDGAVSQLETTARATPGLASVQRWSRRDMEARLPCLRGTASEHALFSPGCGVADIHGLLLAYIKAAKAAGVEFRFGTSVAAVEQAGGAVRGVRLSTSKGPSAASCGLLVNAAGFAANRVAQLAGARPLAATPFRRHLYVTASMTEVGADWPFVWDVSQGFYFRPEGDGLLMCACDETAWEPPLPDEPTTAPEQRERLAERFSEQVPGLAAARPKRHWAGLRVLTEDGRFAVGFDEECAGLFWVAALGGHGMTTSHAVGEMAAALIDGGAVDAQARSALAVQRLR